MTIGVVDPMAATVLSLLARDHELDEVSGALGQDFNGNPANDDPIRLKLGEIAADRYAIAARRAAILSGGSFTPPSASQINELQNAITAVHSAVISNANANTLIGAVTALLKEYGPTNSK
jgi:hypothetical protein